MTQAFYLQKNIRWESCWKDLLQLNSGSVVLELVQLHFVYSNEYGQLSLGRSNKHFGLGILYNSGMGLFDHWYDARSFISYKLVHQDFYIQPTIDRSHNAYFLEAGYKGLDFLSVEALYSSPFGKKKDGSKTVGIYATYEQDSFSVSLEGQQVYKSATQKDRLIALQLGWQLNYKMGFSLQGGWTSPQARIHPNYDLGLLLWNYTPSVAANTSPASIVSSTAKKADSFQADDQVIEGVMYLSPHFEFNPLDKLAIQAGVNVGWNTDPKNKKMIGYELGLTAEYAVTDGIVWRNQAGLLWLGNKQPQYGFRSQAAIAF